MKKMRKTYEKGTKLCTKEVSEQIQKYFEAMNDFLLVDVSSSSGKSCVVSGPSRMAAMISNKTYLVDNQVMSRASVGVMTSNSPTDGPIFIESRGGIISLDHNWGVVIITVKDVLQGRPYQHWNHLPKLSLLCYKLLLKQIGIVYGMITCHVEHATWNRVTTVRHPKGSCC